MKPVGRSSELEELYPVVRFFRLRKRGSSSNVASSWKPQRRPTSCKTLTAWFRRSRTARLTGSPLALVVETLPRRMKSLRIQTTSKFDKFQVCSPSAQERFSVVFFFYKKLAWWSDDPNLPGVWIVHHRMCIEYNQLFNNWIDIHKSYMIDWEAQVSGQ